MRGPPREVLVTNRGDCKLFLWTKGQRKVNWGVTGWRGPRGADSPHYWAWKGDRVSSGFSGHWARYPDWALLARHEVCSQAGEHKKQAAVGCTVNDSSMWVGRSWRKREMQLELDALPQQQTALCLWATAPWGLPQPASDGKRSSHGPQGKDHSHGWLSQ